jgi:hypothetical protein
MPKHSFTHSHLLYGTPIEAVVYNPEKPLPWWVTACIEVGDIIDETDHLIILGVENPVLPGNYLFSDEDGNVDCMGKETFDSHYTPIR